jgi:phage terminase large subunit-like protein
MPRPANQPLNTNEAFRLIGEELRLKANRPDIHGYGPHYKQNAFHSHGTYTPEKGTIGLAWNFDKITQKFQLKLVRLYIGGNRSGKTVGGIVEDIWWVTKTHPYIDIDAIWPEPIRGRVVTTNFKDGWEKIIRPEFVRWCPLTYLRGNSWATAFDKETKVIHFADRPHPTIKGRIIRGGFIEIMTHEQDLETFAGASRHFVHFDEECDEERYKESMARLIDTGGCAWITMTPVEGMSWTFDTIYEPGLEIENHPRFLIVEVDLFDNPFLSEAERDDVISLWEGDDEDIRVHGKFVRKGGLVYPDFSDDRSARLCHVVEPAIPPKEYLWVTSMDHGLKNPSAWYWHAVNYEGRVLTFQEYYQRDRVISEHAKKVHEINQKLGKEPEYYVGDPSIRNRMPNTGISVFDEYVKFGIIIQHGPELNDIKAGIERVTRYLRTVDRESDGTEIPYWQITSECPRLIWELKRYRWRTFVNKKTDANNNPPELPVKKDDHGCDSCRYFFMSRVDLRQLLDEKKYDLDSVQALIGSASKIYNGGLDYDRDNPYIKPIRGNIRESVWTPEPLNSNSTSWEPEEMMGDEW